MHRPEFVFQTALAIVQAVIQFAPQLVMYGLLRLLEERAGGGPISATAWFLVVALGPSIIIAAWAE